MSKPIVFPDILFAAGLALLASPAVAGSGQVVNKVLSDSTIPHCLIFTTANDAAKYGVSEYDPLYEQTLININNSRSAGGGVVTFTVGDPGPPFRPGDCAGAGVLYVYNVAR